MIDEMKGQEAFFHTGEEAKQRLRHMLMENVLTGDVKLSSGKVSDFYIDGRVVTLSPEGAYLTATCMLDVIKKLNVTCVGGPTMGADPICGAIALLSYLRGAPVQTFIIRKQKKEHGTQKQIEGTITDNSRVALVDDVITTGGSLLEAAKVIREYNHIVEDAIVLVDREEGGREKLEDEGIRLHAIFSRSLLLTD